MTYLLSEVSFQKRHLARFVHNIQELSLLYDDFPVQGAKQRVLGVGCRVGLKGWGGAVVKKRSRFGVTKVDSFILSPICGEMIQI